MFSDFNKMKLEVNNKREWQNHKYVQIKQHFQINSQWKVEIL
jgi:hypothetical protein